MLSIGVLESQAVLQDDGPFTACMQLSMQRICDPKKPLLSHGSEAEGLSVALQYNAHSLTYPALTKTLNLCPDPYVHAGPVYEVITSVPSGQQISNDSLILTPTGANTLTGKLPPSFNATKLLGIGTYQAVFTYYPTSNFTQPFPLVVGFQVVVSLRQPPAAAADAFVGIPLPLLVCRALM